MRTSIVVLAFALTGCATQPEMVWVKPSSTETEFENDRAACNAQALQGGNTNMRSIVLIQHNCMVGKGWRKVTRD